MLDTLGKLYARIIAACLLKWAAYDGSQARIISEGALSEAFEVRSGVRQDCCLAPILFLLYFTVAIRDWRTKFTPSPSVRG